MEYKTFVILISFLILIFSTMLGSAMVFLFKKNISKKMNAIILGFASGIMIAASIFGLLIPSMEESSSSNIYGKLSFFPPVLGLLLGALMLYVLDKVIPHLHKGSNEEEGLKSNLNKNIKFFLAVTIHNIPEGLSVGFLVGSLFLMKSDASNIAATQALILAIGIGIQNIPEGAAVSIPMFGDGISKKKSFLFGTLSGLVEPIFMGIGIAIAQLKILNPWLLSFSAGAMLYVTLDELLPESRKNGFDHFAMWAFMIGFSIMLILEIALTIGN